MPRLASSGRERERRPSRVRSAVAANLGAVAVTLIIQVLQVPLLVHVLGVAGYGQYLILIAVPMYLSLSDLGLLAAGSTALTLSVASADGRSQSILGTMWSGAAAVGTALISIGTVVVCLFPLATESFSQAEARTIIVLYLAYTALLLVSNVFEAILRSAGRFVQGTVLLAVGRLTDFLCGAALVTVTGSPVWLVGGFAFGRLFWLAVLRARARRFAPWAKLFPLRFQGQILKELGRPAAASFALPVGNALLNQGLVLVVGAAIGPVAVVVLTTSRTMVNFFRQFVNAVCNALLPTLTIAAARGEQERARSLIRISVLAMFAAALLAIGGITAFGPAVVEIWTNGSVFVSRGILFWLALSVGLDGIWLLLSTGAISVNRHGAIAVAFMTTSAMVVASCAVFLHSGSSVELVGIILSCQSALMIVAVAIRERQMRVRSISSASELRR